MTKQAVRKVRPGDAYTEKEVERPSASRAPTHNVYEELPASRKPHNGAQRGAKKFNQRFDIQKFETPFQCRIREPVRIPTLFQSRPTKKSKCQRARVPPASREEPGSPRTRCLTDRTHQEFDRQFDQQHQEHQKQFDRECRQQFDRKFIQNFDRRFLQDSDRKSIQDPNRKFDADPTEKFDQSNLNQFA